jgi:protein farnesyltransferase subunit beta
MGQEAHLAPTYAAVNALCILGTEEAYQVINRKTLHAFLMKMRSVEGAFKMVLENYLKLICHQQI